MQTKLAENIRLFRRNKSMTQEQLAEVLGVTVGAVHKWETKLSTPELSLIMEMADVFETSVDVLVGYEISDNRMDTMLERRTQYVRTLDPAAKAEAEKILSRYPNSFRAVDACAMTYLVFGANSRNPDELQTALKLLERARTLLAQNNDPHISEITICGALATTWFLLGQSEKSLELLRQNNAAGIFNSDIGIMLAVFLNRPEEAAAYLSRALFSGLAELLNTITGYVFLFRSRNDWGAALSITRLGVELLAGIKSEDKSGALDKTMAEILALLACTQTKNGLKDDARHSLQKALDYTRRFDADPDYSLKAMRFADRMEQEISYDLLGASAFESVERLISLLDEPGLSAQWKEVISDE